MNAQDIRNKYLEFYAKQQHAIIKRAPLILTDDPTTLFTGTSLLVAIGAGVAAIISGAVLLMRKKRS